MLRPIATGFHALIAAACVAASPAWAEKPPKARPAPSPSATATEDPAAVAETLRRAEMLIDAGRPEEARRLAASVPRTGEVGLVYGGFVDARLAELRGDFSSARDAYRAILARHPELARARLALASVLARLGDADGSRHHYQMVLGADVEATVADRIRTDLAALDTAKRWSVQATFSLVPSSNLSNGTSSGTVLIGGIPFSPSDDGRRRSGVSANWGIDLTWLQPVMDDVGLLATLGTRHVEGPGSTWDQRSVEASLGPQVRIGDGVVTTELLIDRGWFGTAPYSTAWGGRVSLRKLLSNDWRLSGSTRIQRQSYDVAVWQDGWKSTTTVALDRSLGSRSFLRFKGAFEHQTARLGHLSYDEAAVGAGLYLESGLGLILFPEVGIARRRHRETFPLMNEPRVDTRATAGVTLTKRDFAMFGLAPKLIYGFTHNASNVGLYTYDRHDLNLTLTREF